MYALSVSISLAAVLEAVQHAVSTSRSSNFYDFIANSAGILAAAIFFSLFVSDKKWEKFF